MERSFQTKQLLFTRRFLSVRVSRLASRLWAWAARKLLSGAARRMQITGVAWNPRTLWTFALRADRACNPGNVQTSAVGMSSRGQSCMSLSSCSECDGPDRVLPGLIQLPARDGAYKSRCSVLDVMEASTRLINAVPPDVVLAACRALRMAAAAITYLLRSVDVGAQAPTPALGKMASWPSCATRCAKIQLKIQTPCCCC